MTTAIDKVGGLSDSDRQMLRSHCIERAQQLWLAIADDPAVIAHLGLADVDAQKRVATSLARLAQRESRTITRNWFPSHIPDLVVMTILLCMIGAIVFVDRSPQALIARSNLSPFHVITKTDIKVHNAYDNRTATDAINGILGRYTTEALTKGDKINLSKLSDGVRLSNELAGLRVLTVKLQPTSVLSGVKPPVKLGIVLSPRTNADDKQLPIHRVFVLDYRSAPDGIWVVLAVTEAETQEISAELSTGQLIAVGPVE